MSDKKNLKPLVRRAMKGDQTAFEKLSNYLSAGIIRNVSAQLNSKEDVQDVAQEVVLTFYKNIGKLKSPNAFYAYLQEVITSSCMKHNKKHSVLYQAEDIDDYKDELEAERIEQPEAQLEQTELIEQVKRAVDQLPSKQRETLYLYYHDNLPYKVIARMQGITTGAVGSSINKAKRALRDMVEMQEARDMQTDQGDNPGRAFGTAKKRGIGGALTTAVLVDAVSRSADELAPKALVDSLRVYTHNLIIENGGIAAGAAAGIFASTFQHVVVAAVASTLVVGGLGAVGTLLVNTQTAVNKPAIHYISFTSGGSIEFSSSSYPSDINPTAAHVTTKTGTAGTWSVSDQAGTSVLAGQGDTTGEVLANLPHGTYTIHWYIFGSTSKLAIPAVMQREFTVK